MFEFTRYRIGLLIGLAALLVFPLASSFASSPTGSEVDPGFQSYYEEAGGLPVFGYAISEPTEEDGRLAQYFERQRLELHPEFAGTPYEVLLGHLGLEEAERRGLAASEAFQPRSNGNGVGEFFSETGHNLGGIFQDYWRSHGLEFGDNGVSFRESLALFGYPISEEFTDPDTGLVTQYFERARFEHHPEHDGTEYAVLLGHLGHSEVDFLRANGRGPDGNGAPGQQDSNDETNGDLVEPEPTPEQEEQSSDEIAAGTSIQQMVDNASSGATVRVPAGIYRETVTINKPITLIGESGAEIRGDDANGNVVREYWIVGRSDNVTIEGFTMRYASTPLQHGALTNNGHDNWTIQNNDLAYADGANVSLRGGDNLKLINNEIHSGGQLGVHGNDSTNVLVSGNSIYNNNTDGHDAFWEAGGMKLAWFPNASRDNPSNIVVEGNNVYGNEGHGLWVDLWAYNVVFRNNNVYENGLAGIVCETCTNTEIHDNRVWKNGLWEVQGPGGSGIYVQATRDANVYNNVVAWNTSGIVVWNEARADHEDAPGPMVNVNVYENDVFSYKSRDYDVWALAWINWNNPDTDLGDSGANNWGRDNRYWHSNENDPGWPLFRWEDRGFEWWELSSFNETPGDSGASQISQSAKDTILSSSGIPLEPNR